MLDGSPFECHEDIVLVRIQKLIAGGSHIPLITEGEIPHGILVWEISLGGEGIGHFPQSLPSLVGKAIFQGTLQKPMFVEMSRGLRTGSQSESLHEVASYHRVYWADVHLARPIGAYTGLHIVLYECFGYP